MDDCYGKGDRIPRELLHSKDRMTNKHIQTLSFLQDIVNENNQLKQRKEELENEQGKCQEIHALAEESQNRIKDIEENCLKRADEINQMLADQHRTEMMQVLDEKMEMERNLKEEILKLRHEVEALKKTNTVLQEDKEWLHEKQALQSRLTELEQLVQGLQTQVKDKKAERSDLQISLNHSQAWNSELHQLQDLRAMNQSLTDELKETNQKNLEFVYKIKELEKELRDNSTEEEHLKLMEALRNKTEKLLKKKEITLMKEADMKLQCENLALLKDEIQKKVDLLEKDCAKLAQELQQLQQEYNRLHRRLQQDEDKAAFKEFWALKRELNAVKDENEILRLKVVTSLCSLPLLKDDQPPPGQRPVSKPKGKKKLLDVSSCPGDGSSVDSEGRGGV